VPDNDLRLEKALRTSVRNFGSVPMNVWVCATNLCAQLTCVRN